MNIQISAKDMNAIMDDIANRNLLPKKELVKLKFYIKNNSNYAQNFMFAYKKLYNKKDIIYFQEFLTKKNLFEQSLFLKKFTGLRGFLNKAWERKDNHALKLGKLALNITALYFVKALPIGIVLKLALQASSKLHVHLVFKAITNNFSVEHPTLQMMNRRVKEATKKGKDREMKAILDSLFRIIPESAEYKHKFNKNEKMKYFNESIEIFKKSDRKIKAILKDQDILVVFDYINKVRKEIKKLDLTVTQALSTSGWRTNQGLACIQARSFIHMMDKQNIFQRVAENLRNAEMQDTGEIIGVATSTPQKFIEEYKTFRVIDDENTPKEYYKDALTEKLYEKIGSNTQFAAINTSFNAHFERLGKEMGLDAETTQILAEKLLKLKTEEEAKKDKKGISKIFSNVVDFISMSSRFVYVKTGSKTVVDYSYKKMENIFLACRKSIGGFCNEYIGNKLGINELINKTKKALKKAKDGVLFLFNIKDDSFNFLRKHAIRFAGNVYNFFSEQEKQFERNFKDSKVIEATTEISVMTKADLNSIFKQSKEFRYKKDMKGLILDEKAQRKLLKKTIR